MSRRELAAVLSLPPAEVRFGDLDQMWRGANLRSNEPVHRQARPVNSFVRVRELHRASLGEARLLSNPFAAPRTDRHKHNPPVRCLELTIAWRIFPGGVFAERYGAI